MYSKISNLVLGFHGCGKDVYDKVLHNHEEMASSNNTYDWLGSGIYFWENGYDRALDWALTHRRISSPAVIGAIIDLGNCLSLTDYGAFTILKQGYDMLLLQTKLLNQPMPENKNTTGNNDLLLRNLDCAVIQTIHQMNIEMKKPPFDSVRGAFIEGDEPYPFSGFRGKTHIQICVCNPNCIKGYFAPREQNGDYVVP